MSIVKNTNVQKKSPSALIKDQKSGKSLMDRYGTPEIVQFLNIADFSIYPDSQVPIDQPLFQPDPVVVQFSDYEPLQQKEGVLYLRNKDKVARRVKIIQPDSRLFSVQLYQQSKTQTAKKGKKIQQLNNESGSKVAPGMTVSYLIKFIPEAKVDYSYDLLVVTEREKFIVPIKAVGQRAMIDFPDHVDFGVCPVKHNSSKPVMIRNVGEKPTKWKLKIPPPFSAEKLEGLLEIGQIEQLALFFLPQESRIFKGEIILQYDGLEAYITTVGEAHNDSNVYLSKNYIPMKEAYIDLTSQSSFKIVNKSNVPVEFEWRAFANEKEEQEKKQRLLLQLAQEEAEERMLIEESLNESSGDESLDSDDSWDELECRNMHERRQMRALLTLDRKYRNIRQAVEEDLMLFQDDIFNIEPQAGKIWPNSELSITITFRPKAALHYECTAYCNVTCSEERLPLQLVGEGIGPKAQIGPQTDYDMGDVPVNCPQRQEFTIENKGAIECMFKLAPYDTPFGNKFTFDCESGVLAVKESKIINVNFQSDLLGEFCETFRFQLQGSSEMLSITFKGHVVAPTFSFNKEKIDFGDVSYNQLIREIIKLTNTSDVGFTFNIRVPGDGKLTKKEFDIIPSRAFLQANETCTIQIDFISQTVKKYDMVLVVDIEGVGQDMLAIPIKAECHVPEVQIIPKDNLEYGHIFLRFPCYQFVELFNKSKLRAKYEVLPQEEQSKLLAIYKAEPQEGYIEPGDHSEVKVTLEGQKRGQIRIPIYFKVVGDSQHPTMLTINAECTGPIVKVLTPEIDFSRVEVLKDVSNQIKLHNNSDIPANYRAFTKKRDSIFRIPEKQGTLQPNETRTLEVICCADECMAFTEQLHFSITDGKDVDVMLKAKGFGVTAYCKDNLKLIDFGTQFTCTKIEKTIVIENKGRKPQKIQWNRVRGGFVDPNKVKQDKNKSSSKSIIEVSKVQSQEEKKDKGKEKGKKGEKGDKEKEEKKEKPQYVFSVYPESYAIQTKHAVKFKFIADAATAATASEGFLCTSIVGNDKKPKNIYETVMTGEFIDPMLQFSDNLLSYKYIWRKDEPILPLSKDLEVLSVTQLNVKFLVKVQPPFSITGPEECELEPGQSIRYKVDFDPGRYDKRSCEIKQQLQIQHINHPRKDAVDLFGEVVYPNLSFDSYEIDFGSILNDTSKKMYINIKNITEIDVKYEWSLVQEMVVDQDFDQESATTAEQLPLNEFFDILPIRGLLKPGEMEQVEFVFNAQSGIQLDTIATCSVEGGPEYEIRLIGQASHVDYKLSCTNLDFGEVQFNETVSQEFFIENTSKVAFQFNISLLSLSRPGIIEVQPSIGKIAAQEKQKILVRLFAGIPDQICENFMVEVAHFAPVSFQVTATGTYPGFVLALPRIEDAKFQERLEVASAKILSTSQQSSYALPPKSQRSNEHSSYPPELEAEIDRIFMCETLTTILDDLYVRGLKPLFDIPKTPKEGGPALSKTQKAPEGYSPVKVVVGNWLCNFGSIVLGQSRMKKFRIFNISNSILQLVIDSNMLKNAGFQMEPSKINKLGPKESIEIKMTYQTRRSAPLGINKTNCFVDVKGGLTYQLTLQANLTIPDIQLSTDFLDFGKVCVGHLCLGKVKFQNIKDVPCEWNYIVKHVATGLGPKDRDWERYQVEPSSGVLQPNQKQVVDILFVPSTEKLIAAKLNFRVKENPNQKQLNVKGQGILYKLEIIPNTLIMGPVLPYEISQQLIEIKNTTELPIEFFCVEFDSKYKEEEEMLKEFYKFETEVFDMKKLSQKALGDKPILMTPRHPGDPLWKEVVNNYEKKKKKQLKDQKIQEMKKKLESENPEEQQQAKKFLEEVQLVGDDEESITISYPQYIPLRERFNIIVYGKHLTGKTTFSQNLQKKHNRALINIDQLILNLLDYLKVENPICSTQQLELAQQIQKNLDQLHTAFETEKEERQKARKGKKKIEDDHEFVETFYIDEKLIKQAIEDKLKGPECNAGVIIDSLDSKYCQNPLKMAKIVAEALSKQQLRLVFLTDDQHLIQIEDKPTEVQPEEKKVSPAQAKISSSEQVDVEAQYIELLRWFKEAQQEESYEEMKMTEKELEQEKQAQQDKSTDKLPGQGTQDKLSKDNKTQEQLSAQLSQEISGIAGEGGQFDQTGPKYAYRSLVYCLPLTIIPPQDQEIVLEQPQITEGMTEEEIQQLQAKYNQQKETLKQDKIIQQLNDQFEELLKHVPAPIFPDPDTIPLPPPQVKQIVYKPKDRDAKQGKKQQASTQSLAIQKFKIGTPISQPIESQEGEEKKEEQELQLDFSKTRWIVPPFNSQKLYLQFQSKEIGNFDQVFNFEMCQGKEKPITLSVQGICDFPMINNNYQNLFMKRKRVRPTDGVISHHFIVSENKFEFGPLLIHKNPETRGTPAAKQNSDVIRISNCGKYPLHIDFVLRSSAQEPGVDIANNPFIIEPESLDLEIDETQELKIFSFPQINGNFTDEIICLVKDNPNPVVIPVQCQGESPTVEVDTDVVEFQRQLLQQTTVKQLTVKNVCNLPVIWNLKNTENLPEELKISQIEGRLKPKSEIVLDVTFKSIQQKKFNEKVILEVKDCENLNQIQDPKPIQIIAEAFNITVGITFNDPDDILNFENVKVFEEKEETFYLKNNGMYDVKYKFNITKKQIREVFTIDPIEGVLTPNQEQPISVTFKSNKEMKLNTKDTKSRKQTSDIILQILEGKTLEHFEEVPIHYNVNAVFSKFSINPIRNINFGPVQFEDKKIRNFEIKNEGIFEFNFNIYELIDGKAPVKEEEEVKPSGRGAGKQEAKDQKKGGKKDQHLAQSVEIGQFVIAPQIGTIQPNQSALIEVHFNATGAKLYTKQMGIDIQNRDPSLFPEGIPYDLAGESCIPGINTWDLDMIFEEQTVIATLDPSANAKQIHTSNVFAQAERVFLFGTLIASKHPEGTVEKFKIMNASKIPCTVNFSVKPRTSSKSEGFDFEVAPSQAKIPPHEHIYVKCSFKPKNMMAYGGIFEAIVENGQQNPKTGILKFELRGEGTLPTVTGQNTAWTEDGKALIRFKKTRCGKRSVANFSAKNEGLVPATVRFDNLPKENFAFLGAVTATIEPKASRTFEFEFFPKEPGKHREEVKMQTIHNPYENPFICLEGEAYTEDVSFENLPFDQEDTLKFGDCAVNQENWTKFRVTNHTENVIRFVWPSLLQQIQFFPAIGHLSGKSSMDIKAKFLSSEPLSLNQAIQLNTQKIKQKGAAFESWNSEETITQVISEKQKRQNQRKREMEEKLRKEQEELLAQQAAKKQKGGKKQVEVGETPRIQVQIEDSGDEQGEEVEVEEPKSEPDYQAMDNSMKEIPLKIQATSDWNKYSCEIRNLVFRPTLMFAVRSHKFNLRNESNIAMKYKFKICNVDSGKLDAGPYQVLPREGTIAPQNDETIIVKFAPKEVDEKNSRLLVCSISDLDPSLEPLVIELKGKSERPVCHFELPPSNYREKKAQDMTPIDSNLLIIEFESLGTKVKNTKRFYVVNPTSQGYEFEWICTQEDRRFICQTQKGLILSGKKFEMVFEYIPDQIGTHESYWSFKIPQEGINQQFLVVGVVNEPVVEFQKGKISFGALLIGGKAKEIVNLVNQEHIPFSFTFNKNSISGEENYADSLQVTPQSGVVSPNSQIPIEIIFSPKVELEFNYNLICNIKRKNRPLVLNVKGEGYIIKHKVFVENTPITYLDPFTLEMEQVFVNESFSRRVYLQNLGQFNFDFSWKKIKARYIVINPEQGTVKKGEKFEIEVKYSPQTENKLNAKVQLSIVSGPTYSINILGGARKPGVSLSFTQYDFGPCFVLRQPIPKVVVLEMVNNDSMAISVETNFMRLPHLDVQLSPGQVLLPSTPTEPKKLEIPIVFTPREIMQYQQTIEFDFNNVHKVQVQIKGEGCPLKLELENREQEQIDFGVVRVGGDLTKTVNLVNRSKKGVEFILLDQAGDLIKNFVTFAPSKEVFLKPKEILPIEIRFKPSERIPGFKRDLSLQIIKSETRKMLSIQGVCHGIELKLMEEVVGFGSVVVNSQTSKKIQLVNLGDVNARFQWESGPYQQYFDIQPNKGVLPAHEDMYFEITFAPNAVDDDIKFTKVHCNIENSDPLLLSLMGRSVPQPAEQIKELKFDTIVRQQQVLKVQIKNPTQKPWRINPSISTTLETTKGYFKGPAALDIQPNQTSDYEVKYQPMTMTKKEQEGKLVDHPHEGALFFPLPDGSGLLYNLIGIAREPKAEETIDQEVVSKTPSITNINVKNWLPVTQRFKVSWQQEGEAVQSTLLRGANTIDVPGNSVKVYKLNILAHKTGINKFNIKFLNENSNEYQFFLLNLKIVAKDKIAAFKMETPVRETAIKVITIENPLQKEITFSKITCDNLAIMLQPDQLKIGARSEKGFEIHYRPLVVGDSKAKVIATSEDLGDYLYELTLKALQSSQQRSMHFKTSLGTELVQAFRFTHFLKKQVQYQAKIETLTGGAQEFFVDKPNCDVGIAESYEGIEGVCDVRYEPCNLRASRAILTLTHVEGGTYTCLLNGQATAPKPQGPFKSTVKGLTIDFKNPFAEDIEFEFRIDNPSFTTAMQKASTKIQIQVNIAYKQVEGYPTTGRLIVSTGDLPPWIYYLTGIE